MHHLVFLNIKVICNTRGSNIITNPINPKTQCTPKSKSRNYNKFHIDEEKQVINTIVINNLILQRQNLFNISSVVLICSSQITIRCQSTSYYLLFLAFPRGLCRGSGWEVRSIPPGLVRVCVCVCLCCSPHNTIGSS